ncbi:MAG: hypothetical protein ACIALR_09500, partial [Blastopirellula sp. JB062]
MADAIKDSTLFGKTIRYGEVQFGGVDGPSVSGANWRYSATPPQFAIHAQSIPDDSGRVQVERRVRLD